MPEFKSRIWILPLIFVLVFNSIFFGFGGTEHPASVWVAWLFLHIACAALAFLPVLAGKSGFLSVKICNLINLVYFILEFIICMIFILLKPESARAGIILQLILTGIFAAVMLTSAFSEKQTSDSIRRQHEEGQYLRDAAAKLQLLRSIAPDEQTRKQIEMLYDLIRSSPLHSSPEAAQHEAAVMEDISALQSAMNARDTEHIRTALENIRIHAETRNTLLLHS